MRGNRCSFTTVNVKEHTNLSTSVLFFQFKYNVLECERLAAIQNCIQECKTCSLIQIIVPARLNLVMDAVNPNINVFNIVSAQCNSCNTVLVMVNHTMLWEITDAWRNGSVFSSGGFQLIHTLSYHQYQILVPHVRCDGNNIYGTGKLMLIIIACDDNQDYHRMRW